MRGDHALVTTPFARQTVRTSPQGGGGTHSRTQSGVSLSVSKSHGKLAWGLQRASFAQGRDTVADFKSRNRSAAFVQVKGGDCRALKTSRSLGAWERRRSDFGVAGNLSWRRCRICRCKSALVLLDTTLPGVFDSSWPFLFLLVRLFLRHVSAQKRVSDLFRAISDAAAGDRNRQSCW